MIDFLKQEEKDFQPPPCLPCAALGQGGNSIIPVPKKETGTGLFPILWILFLPLLFLFSCNSTQNKTTLSNNYFDSESFFKQQIDFLYKAQPKLFITATADNKTEQRENKTPDWKRELGEFMSSDIHKTSFNGMYNVDTSIVKSIDDTSILVSYIAKEENLKTRKIEVYLSPINKSVMKVHIVNSSKNFLSSMSEELDYNVGKGYKIYSVENTRFIGTDIYEVEAEIEFEAGYFQ